jgi:ribonuclease HII
LAGPDQGRIFSRATLYPDLQAVDQTFRSRGVERLAGVDEVGRGALAGPLVAAAVILKPDCGAVVGLRDSKALSADQRTRIRGLIEQSATAIGIGIVDAAEIDAYGVEKAAVQAMGKAVEALCKAPELVLIDGLRGARLAVPQRTLVKGDAKSQSIAAASVIAKVTRDRIMLLYHHLYPQYGFDRHKGYGTRGHLEAIGRCGISPIHRTSFHGAKAPGNEPTLPLFPTLPCDPLSCP